MITFVCTKENQKVLEKEENHPLCLLKTGAKIGFYPDFDLVNFYTIFCLLVVMMFLPFFENTISFPVFQSLLRVIPVIINLCFQFYDVFQKCTHFLHK